MFKYLLLGVSLVLISISSFANEVSADFLINDQEQLASEYQVMCSTYASSCSIGASSMTCGSRQFTDGGCSVECPSRVNIPVCTAAKCGFNGDYYPSTCGCR